MEDFQIYNYNKNIEMLEKKGNLNLFIVIKKNLIKFFQNKATYIGAICTSNLTDNLIKVKSTINLLIKVFQIIYQ